MVPSDGLSLAAEMNSDCGACGEHDHCLGLTRLPEGLAPVAPRWCRRASFFCLMDWFPHQANLTSKSTISRGDASRDESRQQPQPRLFSVKAYAVLLWEVLNSSPVTTLSSAPTVCSTPSGTNSASLCNELPMPLNQGRPRSAVDHHEFPSKQDMLRPDLLFPS